jgi:hypothetical protein
MHFRILILTVALATHAFSQGGPLTPPPGAPVPTMKTLDQVEPGTPLVTGAPGVAIDPSGTITISQPGAYHLTANLTVTSGNGITITSDNVTLDLRGFTIATTGTGGIGINISGRTRISIRNGHIRSGTTFTAPSTFTPAGFGGGIDYSGGAPGIIRVANVSIEGVQNFGIDLGPSLAGIVESCVVRVAQFNGIRAGVVSDSVALLIGETPIIADAIDNSIGRKIDGTAINTKEEKRTPITTVPFTISQPGSYYLTQNLTVASGNAITITTGGVTLDLNGFAITSSASPAAGNAILLNKAGDLADAVTIRNGHIRRANPAASGTGFGEGIKSVNVNFGMLVSGVHVSDCAIGIEISPVIAVSTVVEDCTVNRCTLGIIADTVRNCVVEAAANTAISAKTVDNCVGRSSGSYGIFATTVSNSIGSTTGNSSTVGIFASVVHGSTASATSGIAISAPVVSDSRASATTGTAIAGRQISNCFASATTGIGINTTGTASHCRVEVNSGAVAITGLHAFACTVSAGSLNNATNKNFCY